MVQKEHGIAPRVENTKYVEIRQTLSDMEWATDAGGDRPAAAVTG